MAAGWFEEMKQRRVFRALIGYGIVSFAILQIVEPIMHGLSLPEWVLAATVIALGIGFPITLVLAWVFDVNAGRIETAAPQPPARVWLLLVALGVALGAPGVGWYFWKQHRAPRADEARRALDAVPPASDIRAPPSIAVLPFADMSAAKDQEYFADGLAEELLNLLAKVPGLRVTARTSTFSFKGKSVKIGEIARELGVATILEGSVRKAGDQVRITTQLINAGDGFHLWSETYDRKLVDIFKVQDEIAQAVVGALKLKLLPASAPRGSQTASPEAYNQLLLGREFMRRQNEKDFRLALQAFRRALELDPGYAPAWAAVAGAEGAVANEVDSAEEIRAGRERGCEAAEKAISLAPGLPDSFLARISCRIVERFDWTGAGEDLHRALELAPESANVLGAYAYWFLRPTGRLPEAVAAFRKVTETDPLNAAAWKNLGHTQVFEGDLGPARKALDRSLQLSPSQSSAAYYLCLASLLERRPAEALASAQRSTADVFRLVGAAMAHHDLGHAQESQRILDDMIARFASSGPYQIAEVYAWRGDRDRAFEWLEMARERGDAGLLHTKVDPTLRGLHGDARWKPLLKSVNLPLD